MTIERIVEEFAREVATRDDAMPYVCMSKPFVPGESLVHYSGPYWDERELAAAVQSLAFGAWLPAGESVRAFERAFSSKFRAGHSLMVNSGSSANLTMIAAAKKHFGWHDGDEIIVSAVGFPTTYAPIIQNGLRPVLVDIELGSLNFDTYLIEQAMTSSTVAVLVSPVLGNPPEMAHLPSITATLLDNCDSLGSRYVGQYLNELAFASSCSFYPAHHTTTGEGGMVSSHDEDFVKIARSIAWWGRDCYCVGAANDLPQGTCKKRFSQWLGDYDGVVDHKYVFTNVGYNLKPLDLQGAVGIVQLDKFDEIHAKRRRNKKTLQRFVQDALPDVHVPVERPAAEASWFGLPIVCSTKEQKRSLQAHLEAAKIQTRNYFAGNIVLHPAYAHLGNQADYPNANQVLDRVFFIGVAPHYTQEVLEYVGEAFRTYASKRRLA